MKKAMLFVLGGAALAVLLAACPLSRESRNVEVTIAYEEMGTGPVRHLSPGVWAVLGEGQSNPFFTTGSAAGKAMGLKELAEVGNNKILNRTLSDKGVQSGTFGGADTGKKGMITFQLKAVKTGDRLYFVTMVAPSNDWIAASGDMGLALLDQYSRPVPGSRTVYIYDAGTEEENAAHNGPADGPDDDDMTVRVVRNAMFKVTVTLKQL